MTLRERLADWLTGGALTRARRDASLYSQEMYRSNRDFDAARNSADSRLSELIQSQQQANAMRDTLRRIAACETPGANATVRRMAKMAREAVE